jgi:hypothetical protein
MPRRRQRQRAEKERRHAASPAAVYETESVVRLAYTRTQAAEALGISRSTFNRRVLPLIETIEMPWGARLVPVDELERLVAERRRPSQMTPTAPRSVGRRSGVPDEIVRRIRAEARQGRSLAAIAARLNEDATPTAQGGQRWWPSTVKAIRDRQSRQASPTDSGLRVRSGV